MILHAQGKRLTYFKYLCEIAHQTFVITGHRLSSSFTLSWGYFGPPFFAELLQFSHIETLFGRNCTCQKIVKYGDTSLIWSVLSHIKPIKTHVFHYLGLLLVSSGYLPPLPQIPFLCPVFYWRNPDRSPF